MDELLTAINKALSYVTIVQCACDQQRALLEKSFNREFQHYVKEWNQNEITKGRENEDIEIVQEEIKILELEEIALADNLLRKARRIREKFKVPSLDLVNPDEVNKFSSTNGDEHEQESSQSKPSIAIKQSTSLPVMNPNKSRIPSAPMSSRTLKEQRVRSSDSISRDRIPPPKVLTHTRQAIVTKSQLHSYKELCAKTNLRTGLSNKSRGAVKNESSTKLKSSTLGNLVQKPSGGNKTSKTHLQIAPRKNARLLNVAFEEKQRPTCKDFLKFSQGNVLHPNFMHHFWYPFLNPANAARLTTSMTFTSAKELKQIHTLLHNIQEIIFWLDLFSILGKDVIPHLNTKQQEGAVMCSYVQSIFHPKLRRKPMIIEPSFDP